jgi:hypothetical protein
MIKGAKRIRLWLNYQELIHWTAGHVRTIGPLSNRHLVVCLILLINSRRWPEKYARGRSRLMTTKFLFLIDWNWSRHPSCRTIIIKFDRCVPSLIWVPKGFAGGVLTSHKEMVWFTQLDNTATSVNALTTSVMVAQLNSEPTSQWLYVGSIAVRARKPRIWCLGPPFSPILQASTTTRTITTITTSTPSGLDIFPYVDKVKQIYNI